MNRTEYVNQLFVQEDDLQRAVREGVADRGMPSIHVSPELGKLLSLLVKISGAKSVLEIGVLGGYSGLWLGRALPDGGKLTSLEINPDYAAFARSNLEKAGLGQKVEYRIGPALDSLKILEQEGRKFDMFFIDADKDNYPNYLDYAVRLANPGAIITADNVLWGDRVLDPADQSASTEAIRRFNSNMASDKRLESLLLPIRDGLAVARVI